MRGRIDHHSRPVEPPLLGRGALQRALVEDTPAFGADRALELVRDAEPLQQHVRPHAGVPVKPLAMRKNLAHRPRLSVVTSSEHTTLKRVTKLFRFGNSPTWLSS